VRPSPVRRITSFSGEILPIFSISHLKKVFSSDIGVEPSSQVLDILEYACGLILSLALISNENPNFEMASKEKFIRARLKNPG
jgi:hypothetical protein